MTILVFSDTHGDITRAEEIVARITKGTPVDLLIHCGDLYRDAIALRESTGIPVDAVYGNCDGPGMENYTVVETPAGNVLVTHGSKENADYGYDVLLDFAKSEDCRCVCFGHTHVPVNEDRRGIRLLNPGSLSSPRGGSVPSCAMIVATEKSFVSTIIPY